MARKTKADTVTAISGRGGSRPGAGRKPIQGGGAVPVSASVPADLVKQFDEVTAAKGWTRSQAVTEAIRRLVAETKQ